MRIMTKHKVRRKKNEKKRREGERKNNRKEKGKIEKEIEKNEGRILRAYHPLIHVTQFGEVVLPNVSLKLI
jgi:hypothetical protein